MASLQVQKSVEEMAAMQPQNGTMVVMNNKTPMQMTLQRSINWSGDPSAGSFPSFIAADGTARFTHLKSGEFGSEGAVQYDGVNAMGGKCAWILAWNAPVESDVRPNKVYLTCGTKSAIDAMSWGQVRQTLDVSTSYAQFTNQASKTVAWGEIHDLVANTASLHANFGLTA